MNFSIGDIVYFDKVLWYQNKQKNHLSPTDNDQLLLSDYKLYINLCKQLEQRHNIKDKTNEEIIKTYDYWIVTNILTTVSDNILIKLLNTSHISNKCSNKSHTLFNSVAYITYDNDVKQSIFLKKL